MRNCYDPCDGYSGGEFPLCEPCSMCGKIIIDPSDSYESDGKIICDDCLLEDCNSM